MDPHKNQQEYLERLVKALALHYEVENWQNEKEAFENPDVTTMTDQEKDARMMDMLRCPVKSFEIELTGNKKTNEQFILEHFDFSGIETTADSIVGLEMTRNKLLSYQIFDDIEVEVDRGDRRHELSVKVDVKEKDRLFAGSVGAETNQREVLGKAGWGLKNVGGRGESLTCEISGGGANEDRLSRDSVFWTTHKFTVGLNKPRIMSTDRTLVGQVFSKSENHTRNSSYIEDVQGFSSAVIDDSGAHRFGYNCELRMVKPTSRSADASISPSVQFEGGEPSLKSSIFYSYTNDNRQNMLIPVSGSMQNINLELAGLGGNVEFLKAQSFCSWHFPFLSGVFNVGFQSGFITPLGKLASGINERFGNKFQDKSTRINDRLQIGGRLLARGYQYGKIGDKDGEDYLNGDMMYCGGVSYSFPIGRTSLAGHLFATAGNVLCRSANAKCGGEENTLKSDVQSLFRNSRTSMGASIVIPFPVGRLEFGLAIPILKTNVFDDPFSNLFWGLDLNFL